MRTLLDDAGNQVEVPDQEELDAMKAKADNAARLEAEMKEYTDKNVGLKNLREAVDRKDKRVLELEKEMAAFKVKPTERPVDPAAPTNSMTQDEIRTVAREASLQSLVEMELNRDLASLDETTRAKVQKNYGKLTAGESVNMETVHVYLADAKRAAGVAIHRDNPRPYASGRPPHSSEGTKSKEASENVRAMADRLGLKIDPPVNK